MGHRFSSTTNISVSINTDSYDSHLYQNKVAIIIDYDYVTVIQCKPSYRRSQDIELKKMEESLEVVHSESLSAYERKKGLEKREAEIDKEIIQLDEEIGKLESKKDQINEQLLSQVSLGGVGVNNIQKEHT